MSFYQPPDQFFDTSFGKIHYRCFGESSNQSILVFPGITFSSSTFTDFADFLSQSQFYVLVIDYFGREYSIPYQAQNVSTEIFISAFQLLMKQLNLLNPFLIAFSFGCCVASSLLKIDPNFFQSVIFISPITHLIKPLSAVQSLIIANTMIGPTLLKYFSPKLIPSEIFNQLSEPFRDDVKIWSTVSTVLNQIQVNPFFYEATSVFLREQTHINLADELTKFYKVTAKCFILIGQLDKSIDINLTVKWWKTSLSNSHTKKIRQVGHLMHIENPKFVAESCVSYLRHKPKK